MCLPTLLDNWDKLVTMFCTFQITKKSLFDACKCSLKNFANDWILTSDLWFWKWLLCQLSHNHCPMLLLHFRADYLPMLHPSKLFPDLELEAVSQTSDRDWRRRPHHLQVQVHLVHRLNRGSHLLPHEVQRLPPGPSGHMTLRVPYFIQYTSAR